MIDLRNDDEVDPGSAPTTTLGAGTFTVPAANVMAERPAGIRTVQIPLDDIDDTAFWHQVNGRGLNGTPLYFRSFMQAKPQRIAAVLNVIAQTRQGGIIFHCGAGRDRAGLISLVLLSLAGVTPDAITEDYELSLGQIHPLFAALGIERRETSMDAFLQQQGTTVREAILDLLDGLDMAQYLTAAGLSQADIAILQHRLVRD